MTASNSQIHHDVLVVDDVASVRNFLVTLLSRAGFDAVGAADAPSAIALLEVEGFDLLVTDVRMPGMNRFELVRDTRESHPDMRIVVMTGAPDVSSAEWPEACGKPMNAKFPVDGIWLKPLRPTSILNSVRKFVTH